MALSQMDDLARAKVTYFFQDDPNPRPDGLVRMKILPWCKLTLSDGTEYYETLAPAMQLGSGPSSRDDEGIGTTQESGAQLFAGVAGGVVPTEFIRAEDRCGVNFGQPYPAGNPSISTSGQGGKDGEVVNAVHFMGPV